MKRALALLLALSLALLLALSLAGGAWAGTARKGAGGVGGGLPGISGNSISIETLRAITNPSFYITPPEGLPQYYFSAAPENDDGVVTASTASTVELGGATVTEGAWIGMRAYCRSGACRGQIRDVIYNDATGNVTIFPPWGIVPACSGGGCTVTTTTDDVVEIFTGDLIPGTLTGTGDRNDPFLDVKKAHELGLLDYAWLWWDTDVWDVAATEWCIDTPAGRCTGWRQGITVDQGSGSKAPRASQRDHIIFGISGLNTSGYGPMPVFDCDAANQFPRGSGGTGSAGLFETSFGVLGDATTAYSGWAVVQGIRTHCWNTPAPTGASSVRTGAAGQVGVFRVELGNMLVLHTEHGVILDSGVVASVSSSNASAGFELNLPVRFYAFDVRASLGNFEQFNESCTADDTPYMMCSAAGVSNNGSPKVLHATNADVLWVGGNWVYQDYETTTDASAPGSPRDLMLFTGGSQTAGGGNPITLFLGVFNSHFASTGDNDFAQAIDAAMTAGPDARFHLWMVNSATRNMRPAAGSNATINLQPGAASGGTRIDADLINVTGAYNGAFFNYQNGAATDLGGTVRGRCLLIDEAVTSVWSDGETTAAERQLRGYDLEGVYDEDDAASDFNFAGCSSSTLAGFLAGACFGPGNPGTVAGWKFFQANSAEIGGVGTDDLAFARPLTVTLGDVKETARIQGLTVAATGVYTQGYQECTYATSVPLPQPIPYGVVAANVAPTAIRVEGRRNAGMN